MSNPVRWLHEQLPTWVEQGTVSAEQADAIRDFYPQPKGALPWGTLIFSGIGAVVIGLGVILLFAYNWQAIPKFWKLGVIFGALVVTHAGGLYLSQAADWRRQLGEAVSVLGTMLFGAGIWLVAQIYHIDEHYPNGFLLWGAGALVLAWAMSSVAQGMLAATAITIWGCCERFDFDTAVHWAPMLVAVGVGGLAWRERSRLLLVVTLAGFYLLLLVNSGHSRAELPLPTLLNISALLIPLGSAARVGRLSPSSAGVLRFFGWSGFLFMVYAMTFRGVTADALDWHNELVTEERWLPLVIYGWVPFVLAMAAWVWVVVRSQSRGRLEPLGKLSERWLVPLTALVSQGLALLLTLLPGGSEPFNDLVLSAIYNLIFLAVAGMWMARGCRDGQLRPVVLGSLLLIALVFARYFDLFESLAWRGLVFLIVGGVLFAEGILYRRASQRTDERRVAS